GADDADVEARLLVEGDRRAGGLREPAGGRASLERRRVLAALPLEPGRPVVVVVRVAEPVAGLVLVPTGGEDADRDGLRPLRRPGRSGDDLEGVRDRAGGVGSPTDGRKPDGERPGDGAGGGEARPLPRRRPGGSLDARDEALD